jgi:hypothetical protein
MDPLDNMTAEEAKALEDWEDHFKVLWLMIYANTSDKIHSGRSTG